MYTWMKFTECLAFWKLMHDRLHLPEFNIWLEELKRSTAFPGLYGVKDVPADIRRIVDRKRRQEAKDKK